MTRVIPESASSSDAGIRAPEQLGALAERVHRAQDVAAIGEQSLAFAAQDQPSAHAIEQPHAKLDLEIIDLAGQRGLGDSQAKRSLRDRPLLSNSHKRSHMPQIHAESLCPLGMKRQTNMVLDRIIFATDPAVPT